MYLGTTEPGAIRHPQTLVLPALKSPYPLLLPLALTTAYRLFLYPSSPPTSLASASAAPFTTSSTFGISTHCPTSCGPRLPARAHTLLRYWLSPGGEDGWEAPHPKAMTGGAVGELKSCRPRDRMRPKTSLHSRLLVLGLTSSPGTHTHPRLAALPPCMHAMQLPSCSSGWAPSPSPRPSRTAKSPLRPSCSLPVHSRDPMGMDSALPNKPSLLRSLRGGAWTEL